MRVGWPTYTCAVTIFAGGPASNFGAGLTRLKHLELPVKLNRNNTAQTQPGAKESSK
jgi:hypothetical protein